MKNSLVTAAQFLGTACPIILENLVPYINLNAFSINIFKDTAFMEIRSVSSFIVN